LAPSILTTHAKELFIDKIKVKDKSKKYKNK
jgi:hypothetical protein